MKAHNEGNSRNTSDEFLDCENEKIHLISSFQGHGAFLGISPNDFKILHVSRNFNSFFLLPQPSTKYIGSKIDKVLDQSFAEVVRKKIERLLSHNQEPYSFQFSGDRVFDVFIYQIHGGLVGVEFEECNPTEFDTRTSEFSTEDRLKFFMKSMGNCRTISQLGQVTCSVVRMLTNMERVMLYRFYPPSWDGEVIAEDRVAQTHSFLHQRFPASDIPSQARALYMRNQVRFIYDSNSSSSEVYPATNYRTKTPLDLSDSRLRAVSEAHLKYLRNMNVSSSFSIAVTVDDQLWGLISCHNSKPIYVSHASRSLCQTVANTLSLSCPILEKLNDQNETLNFNAELLNVFKDLIASSNPLNQLFLQSQAVFNLFQCTGMAFISPSKTDYIGLTPLKSDILELGVWLRKRFEESQKSTFATKSLVEIDPNWSRISEQVSGVLAVILPELNDSLFILFRPEIPKLVIWGGDPRKSASNRKFPGPINPRASFEAWTETVKNSSNPWKSYQVEGILRLKEMIFDTLFRNERVVQSLGTSSEDSEAQLGNNTL